MSKLFAKAMRRRPKLPLAGKEFIRESLSQFENGITPRVYIRSITLSTMYQTAIFCEPELSSIACGFSSIKIDYSDYPKSLISRINEVYIFFNKISL